MDHSNTKIEHLKPIKEGEDESYYTQPDLEVRPTEKVKLKEPTVMQMLSLNKQEWFYILIGSLASILSGAASPSFSIVFSKVINVFAECDYETQKNDIILYCSLFVGLGIILFFANFTMTTMFAISGENMTKRLRSKCFQTMLKQDLEWFDKEENNIGSLTTRLSVETAAVQGATGPKIGNTLMNMANLGVGIVIAFWSSWVITLVIIAFIPLVVIAGFLQTKLVTGSVSKDKSVLEDSGKVNII
jgi:ABC-type multidrug transport system fused ATPase/permease subunit